MGYIRLSSVEAGYFRCPWVPAPLARDSAERMNAKVLADCRHDESPYKLELIYSWIHST